MTSTPPGAQRRIRLRDPDRPRPGDGRGRRRPCSPPRPGSRAPPSARPRSRRPGRARRSRGPSAVVRSSAPASRSTMSRSRSTTRADARPLNLDHDLARRSAASRRGPARSRRRRAAPGRRRRTPRRPVGAELGAQHLLDLAPTGAGAAWSCRRPSSSTNSAGSRSRRVDSTWPSLTNVTPASSSARRSDRASWLPPGRVPQAAPAAAQVRAEAVPDRDPDDLGVAAGPGDRGRPDQPRPLYGGRASIRPAPAPRRAPGRPSRPAARA